MLQNSPILLLASLASVALAKTDLTGCTSTDISSPAGASVAWYVPGTGEICAPLDCGGGRAPPRSDVPGCPAYTGTATYEPSYLAGYASATPAAAAASSGTWASASATTAGAPTDTDGVTSSWADSTSDWPSVSASSSLSATTGWSNQTTLLETTAHSAASNGTLTSATLRPGTASHASAVSASSTGTGGGIATAQAWLGGAGLVGLGALVVAL